MQVESGISNPTLRYRLDPGEPGLLRSASAKDSTKAVTSQEQRNINRLRSEAMLEGRMVISANITYRRAIEGSFAAVQAGLTTVVSVSRQKPSEDLNAQPAQMVQPDSPNVDLFRDSENNIAVDAETEESNEPSSIAGAQNTDSLENKRAVEQLRQLEQELQAKVGRLENQGFIASPAIPPDSVNQPIQNARTIPTSEVSATAEDGEGKNNLFQIQQTKQALAKVRAEKIMREITKVQNPVSQAVLDSSSQAASLTKQNTSKAPSSNSIQVGARLDLIA